MEALFNDIFSPSVPCPLTSKADSGPDTGGGLNFPHIGDANNPLPNPQSQSDILYFVYGYGYTQSGPHWWRNR